MAFLTFIPTSGDTDNVLLQKIVQILAAGGGALTMGFLKVLPTSGDTDNVLLQKIVQILAGPTGSGGGVFIAAIGGSGTNMTLAGTTVFSGCIGSHISFCPDDTWDIGIVGARPRSVDVGTSYKYDGVNVIIANTSLENYFFGNSGNFTTTAIRNTAVGSAALLVNTTGASNTAVGSIALQTNTTGINNSAVGVAALLFNTTGGNNVAIGRDALRNNTTASTNSALGVSALRANLTGANNVAVGGSALAANTTGASNSAIGVSALLSNTTGINNSAVGAQALLDLNITAGDGANTAIGFNAGRGITTGINNTIIGANVIGLAAALSNNIIIADGAGNQRIQVASTGAVTIPISLRINGPLIIPTGANQRAGNIALIGGTITVANTTVTANTLVMLTRKTSGGTIGTAITYTLSAGVSFTINSDNPLDTSTFSYFLIENP